MEVAVLVGCGRCGVLFGVSAGCLACGRGSGCGTRGDVVVKGSELGQEVTLVVSDGGGAVLPESSLAVRVRVGWCGRVWCGSWCVCG